MVKGRNDVRRGRESEKGCRMRKRGMGKGRIDVREEVGKRRMEIGVMKGRAKGERVQGGGRKEEG